MNRNWNKIKIDFFSYIFPSSCLSASNGCIIVFYELCQRLCNNSKNNGTSVLYYVWIYQVKNPILKIRIVSIQLANNRVQNIKHIVQKVFLFQTESHEVSTLLQHPSGRFMCLNLFFWIVLFPTNSDIWCFLHCRVIYVCVYTNSYAAL